MDKRAVIVIVFAFLVLLPLALAQLSTTPLEPKEETINVFYMVQAILIMLMIVMMIIAASGYVFGQFFGAETRARIQSWSSGLLAAIGVSALVIILFSFFVPIFSGGGMPTLDISVLLQRLSGLAQRALLYLIVVMVVIAAGAFAIGQLFGAETRAKATVWSQVLLGSALIAALIYIILFYIATNILSMMIVSFSIGGKEVVLTPYRDAVVFVVLLISSVVLITYLAAKIFKVPEWEAYLNIELTNLINSFLLLIFVIGFFAVSSAISTAITGNSSPPLAAAEQLRGYAANVYNATMDVYTIQACTSVLNTFQKRIGEQVLSPTFKVFPGMDTFISMTNILALGFLMIYSSLSVQIFLLNVVDVVMVRFLLPAGLVLRFFPPTREAGAFLISLAFGFQIIFPTAYFINTAALESVGLSEYTSLRFPITSLCGMIYVYASIPPVLIRAMDMPYASAIAQQFQTIFSEGFVHGLSMSIFLPVLNSLAAVSLLGIFSPGVATVITIASINAMTKFIVMKG